MPGHELGVETEGGEFLLGGGQQFAALVGGEQHVEAERVVRVGRVAEAPLQFGDALLDGDFFLARGQHGGPSAIRPGSSENSSPASYWAVSRVSMASYSVRRPGS